MLGIANGRVRANSTLGIGNGRVRVKFEAWNREWRSWIKVPTLGIGNGGVRAKFRHLESEIEEFEPI